MATMATMATMIPFPNNKEMSYFYDIKSINKLKKSGELTENQVIELKKIIRRKKNCGYSKKARMKRKMEKLNQNEQSVQTVKTVQTVQTVKAVQTVKVVKGAKAAKAVKAVQNYDALPELLALNDIPNLIHLSIII